MLRIDHIILAVSSIVEGASYVHSVSGVKPEFGGFHPSYGTCNSILSLQKSYFELLALDPNALEPKTRFLPIFRELKDPKVVSWAIQYDKVDEVVDLLKAHNLSLSEIKQGQRTLPSGYVLSYEFATVLGMESLVDVMPFFIKWKNQSDHPSQTSPKGCALKELEISFPEDVRFGNFIKSMNLGISLKTTDLTELKVTISTPNGDVEF